MRKILILFMIAGLMIFAMGCSKKHAKSDQDRMAGDEIVEDSTLRAATDDVTSTDAESLFKFQDALFDYDKYNIRSDARDVLDSVAAWLKKHKDINVLIEGHCDDRGTNDYNLALGEKRANSARDYLIARGVSSKRMSTLTYGEEKPVCSSMNESCRQNNRRAHFVVTK